jgi:GTPase involved in cell partitioning and DNA repair
MFRRLHARRHESGAAAVEFALVLPILILLIFGIIQYGIYFWARQSAVAAAREAARRSSVGDYASCPDFTTFVQGELHGAETGSGTTVKRSFTKATGNLLTTGQPGDTMEIELQFDSIDIGLIPLPFSGKITINTTSRVESIDTPLEACS